MATPFDLPRKPSQRARPLADVTDEDLVADLIAGVAAVGYWYDAWWSETRRTATKIQQRRAELIETVRDEVALLGSRANMAQLAGVTGPLLGAHFDRPEINAAVDLVRDVTMRRWPYVQRAREDAARTSPSDSCDW